jgi:hypothetical protein
MTLKCQCTQLNSDCGKPAEWIMITGCEQEHIEETPLCTTHLNFYVGCYRQEHNRMLLCDTCKNPVTEYDYCTIQAATDDWVDQYILLKAIRKLSQTVTQTPTTTPWVGTSRTKHTNPQRPPGM